MSVTAVIGNPAAGVNYTFTTDTSADWAAVANSTYFYDLADKLVHFKNASGDILEAFSASGSIQDLADVIGVDANTGFADVIVNTELNPDGIWKMESDNVIPANRTAISWSDGGAQTDEVFIGQLDQLNKIGGQSSWLPGGIFQYHFINANDFYLMQLSSAGFAVTGTGNVAGGFFYIGNELTLQIQGTVGRLSLPSPTLTIDRTQTFQDKNGVIALTSDIPTPTLTNISATDTFTTAGETLNCTSGTFTVNLPTAAGIQGTTFTLVNSGVGVITLDASTTETINGSLTIDLAQYISRTVQSDGTNWIII